MAVTIPTPGIGRIRWERKGTVIFNILLKEQVSVRLYILAEVQPLAALLLLGPYPLSPPPSLAFRLLQWKEKGVPWFVCAQGLWVGVLRAGGFLIAQFGLF